jgi:hypothetical protein
MRQMVPRCVRATGLLVVALLTAGGCAHDLPGWKQAATDHFLVQTDRPRRSYEPLLERLEEVHAGLSSSFFDGTIPPMEVFLFSGVEFHDLAGEVGGLFVTPGEGQSGILVVPEAWDTNYLDRTAAHELAHGFMNARYPGTPLWFNEGFATYCESIMVQEERVWFGSANVHAAQGAANGRLVPVAELFSAQSGRFHGDLGDRHYTTSWAMIHYLWHGEEKGLRRRFDQFRSTLMAGGKSPERSAHAWQAVFPDLPLQEVDGRLRDHLSASFALPRSSLVGFRLMRPALPPLRLAPADMAHVDELRALLRLLRGRREEAAKKSGG